MNQEHPDLTTANDVQSNAELLLGLESLNEKLGDCKLESSNVEVTELVDVHGAQSRLPSPDDVLGSSVVQLAAIPEKPKREPATFMSLPRELRDVILRDVAQSYCARVVEPRFRRQTAVLVERTREIAGNATDVVLPFPLVRAFKEGFQVVLAVSSLSFFVEVKSRKGSSYKKIHYRPCDRLYIRDFLIFTSLISDRSIKTRGFDFCGGIKTISIHPYTFTDAQRDRKTFVRALHRFPHLERVEVMMNVHPSARNHMQAIASAKRSSREFSTDPTSGDQRILGRISYTKLTYRPWTNIRLQLIETYLEQPWSGRPPMSPVINRFNWWLGRTRSMQRML